MWRVNLITLTLLANSLVCLEVKGETIQEQQEATSGLGSATLPLKEILRLQKLVDGLDTQPLALAPMTSSIDKIEIVGRLLHDSFDLTMHVELTVLDDNRWVVVPLFHRDAQTHLYAIPTIPDGVLAVEKDVLHFVTQKAGKYIFDLSIMKQANLKEGNRLVEIEIKTATMALLRVRFDETMFRLLSSNTTKETEAILLYPRNNKFSIQWSFREGRQQKQPVPESDRSTIESVITTALGSVVSTLEGRTIARILYELRLQGNQPISVTVPGDYQVQRIFLNNVSIPFVVKHNTIELTVRPARTGDESARLELLLTKESGTFNLSGYLTFAFPSTSWAINDFFVALHLPEVFHYDWIGGSLAPTPKDYLQRGEFFYQIPIPGKELSFHQQLLSSSPDIRLGYTVDLHGNYFQGN